LKLLHDTLGAVRTVVVDDYDLELKVMLVSFMEDKPDYEWEVVSLFVGGQEDRVLSH
jgi:hypothetical protein